MPLTPTHVGPPLSIISHQSGAFVTADGLTLIHLNHPEPIVYARVYSWWCISVSLDKHIITYIHNYSII